MAHEHQAWLNHMEQQSKAKQQQFMDGIAARLKRPRQLEKPEQPFRGAPEFWQSYTLGEEERVHTFSEHFNSVGGHVVRAADMEEAKAFIVSKAEETGARYLVRQQEPALEALALEEALPEAELSVWNSGTEENWKARAAEADFGIVMADHAVAHTGSVVVRSAKEKGRSVSLLPTVLLIIVPVERIVTRLGEVLKPLDESGREHLPAGIHFISGPSRSSDIENDLTIGVHGPGIVYAILVG
ncbi:LutC/YkgG family protein [Paenibacillus protaetiae]|uniref:Lactate utilization protein C n=1 Tax=Paenibacillus protaetiae TaxID=2509456 RepID=A0A4P6EV44_9BACL|nr:lactate utilization protein [Paenibacillus protaetiae]QAY65519.1 lactate utilization protein C [Paenibacillus protaetiae]